MPIQAVLFDIGGVLQRTEDLSYRRRWEARWNWPDWALAKIVFDNPVAARATIGQATPEQVWAEIARQLPDLTLAEIAQLRAEFWAGDVWDQELLDFLRALRPRCKTGIISNAWADVRAFVRPYVNAEVFDYISFSAEIGAAKPDPRIYRAALTALNIAPAQAVFVDDMPVNVAGAEAVGMRAVRFVSTAQTLADLRALLEAA